MTVRRVAYPFRRWLLWLAGALAVLLWPAWALAAGLPELSVVGVTSDSCSETGEAIVKFRDAVSDSTIASIHATLGAQVVGNVQGTHTQWVKARGFTDEALLAAYKARPEVEWVKPAPNRMDQSSL